MSLEAGHEISEISCAYTDQNSNYRGILNLRLYDWNNKSVPLDWTEKKVNDCHLCNQAREIEAQGKTACSKGALSSAIQLVHSLQGCG